MGSPAGLAVRQNQASFDSLAEVADSYVDVGGNKLQHGVDLVPGVRFCVEWGHVGKQAGASSRPPESVEDRNGGKDQRSRHDSEGKAGRSPQELVRNR